MIVGESSGLITLAAVALCMDITADTFGGLDQFGAAISDSRSTRSTLSIR